MPNVYNFEAGTAVYRTAVPHECTMHGGIRHPDLDLEQWILDPDIFTYSNLPNFEELFRFFEGTGSLQYLLE
jgi:hypothetical protein